MHILQAVLVTDSANATTMRIAVMGACILGIVFMLRFLLALARERKTSLVGHRLEYRIDSSAPGAVNGHVWRGFFRHSPATAVQADRSEYDRGEFATGIPGSLKDARLTFQYRFIDSARQEPNRA